MIDRLAKKKSLKGEFKKEERVRQKVGGRERERRQTDRDIKRRRDKRRERAKGHVEDGQNKTNKEGEGKKYTTHRIRLCKAKPGSRLTL